MENNTSLAAQGNGEERLFAQIKQMLDNARRQIARTVNTATIDAYWQIGKYIVEMNNRGKPRQHTGKA